MTIHCRDFEGVWNEKLDARGTWSAEADQALEAHAAACSTCRAVDARYRALAQAIRMLPAPPPLTVSADFADRVLAAAAIDESRRAIFRLAPRRRRAQLAAAAVVIVAVGLGLRTWRTGGNPPPALPSPPVATHVQAIDPDDLSAALADATSATLALAREASAPAARVGREVLAEADLPSSTPAFGLPEGVVPAVFQGVGARVNAGVRPLSGTARSAFGFLIGTPDGVNRAAPATPPRGA
jgi:hypothetical protein